MTDDETARPLGIAPAQARYEVIAAAEAVDGKAKRLAEPLVEAIVAVRPRTLIRATHRREVLNEIERALADRAGAASP